jgi:hypothetical protein
MAWPPAVIAADKAPGAPSSDTEHPDHHNALAAAVNQVVAYVTWTEVEIDFGTTPQWSKTFTVTDADCTTSALVQVVQSGNVATGRVGNDAEWDGLVLAALPGTGSFVLTALAVPGPIVGARKVAYQIAV